MGKVAVARSEENKNKFEFNEQMRWGSAFRTRCRCSSSLFSVELSVIHLNRNNGTSLQIPYTTYTRSFYCHLKNVHTLHLKTFYFIFFFYFHFVLVSFFHVTSAQSLWTPSYALFVVLSKNLSSWNWKRNCGLFSNCRRVVTVKWHFYLFLTLHMAFKR